MLAEAVNAGGEALLDAEKNAYLESLEDEFGPCLIRERNPESHRLLYHFPRGVQGNIDGGYFLLLPAAQQSHIIPALRIRERNPVLLTYLDWWEELQNKILKEVLTYPNRRDQVEEELRRIRDVRRRMDTDRGGAV